MKKETKKTVSKVKEKVEKKEVIEKKNTDVKKTSKTDKKKTDTKIKKEKKEKKATIFGKIGNWFKEEVLELKRVSWPSKKVVWKNFVATLMCIVFLGVLFYLIDIIIVWLKTVVI